jgi:hypothetical protein
MVLILFAILFPRFMRALFIALLVFVGVAWLIDASPASRSPRRRRRQSAMRAPCPIENCDERLLYFDPGALLCYARVPPRELSLAKGRGLPKKVQY